MLEHILNQCLYVAAGLALVLLPLYLFLLLFRWRRGRRSPISRDSLRGPGESRLPEIARIDDRVNDLIIAICFIPIVAALVALGPALKQSALPGRDDYLSLMVLVAIFLPLPVLAIIRKLKFRADCRLGLDAALAVGRELNLAMRGGFHVFHDLPVESSHIDHVAVGPTGVFTVETKGRPKTQKDRKTGHATVLYTGEALYFPDNSKETGALTRVREQAASLANWLSGAVGEPVQVRSALALPGWYIERQQQDDLLLLFGQGRHYARSLKGDGREILSESLVNRIVQLLDARCREVDPKLKRAEDNNKNGESQA